MLTTTVLFTAGEYDEYRVRSILHFPKPVDPDGLVTHFAATELPNRDFKQWCIKAYEAYEVEYGEFHFDEILTAMEEDSREQYRKEQAAHAHDEHCIHLSTAMFSATLNQSEPN